MDLLLRRRQMMLRTKLSPEGTVYVDVIAYDETDHSWYSVSNMTNAYAGNTSTTYAQINLTRGSNAETLVYFIFEALSKIPSNAYIYYVKCDIKCFSNGTTYAPGTFTLCDGTTDNSSSVAIGNSSNTEKAITSTKWTRAQLDNIRLKVYNKRGTSQTSSAYYDRFYGATLTVQYAVEPEPYLVFEDSEVESVCAAAYGDNIGTKQIQADLYRSTGLSFRGNTDIVSFNELGEYFTNLTTITAGSSTSALGAFGGCTALESITLPDSLTTIGAYAFYDCTSLTSIDIPDSLTTLGASCFYGCTNLSGTVVIPSTVTSVGNDMFYNCNNIENLVVNRNVTHRNIQRCAANGNIFIDGNLTSAGQSTQQVNCANFILSGDFTASGAYGSFVWYTETIRIGGNYSTTSNSVGLVDAGSSHNSAIKLIEIMGTANGLIIATSHNRYSVSVIIHLGYNGIACTPARTGVSNNRVTKVYVGDGSSQAADQAVLDLYLADENWAAYASKLDLWYNYDGEYKTPPTIPTI